MAGGEGQLAQLERDRDALVGARDRRAASEHVLAERRSLLEKARQAERLIEERTVAQERFERYRQAVAVNARSPSSRRATPRPTRCPSCASSWSGTRALDREIGEIRAQLGEEPSAVDYEVRIPEPRYRPFAWLALVLAIGGVAAVALGVFGSIVPAVVAGVIAGIAGVGLAAYARARRTAAFDLRRQIQLRDDEIARRLRGRSHLEDDLRRREGDLKAQLATIEVDDPAGAEDLLAREDAHVQAIDRARAQLDGLVGKEPAETLPTLRDAAALTIEQKTARTRGAGADRQGAAGARAPRGRGA